MLCLYKYIFNCVTKSFLDSKILLKLIRNGKNQVAFNAFVNSFFNFNNLLLDCESTICQYCIGISDCFRINSTGRDTTFESANLNVCFEFAIKKFPSEKFNTFKNYSLYRLKRPLHLKRISEFFLCKKIFLLYVLLQ